MQRKIRTRTNGHTGRYGKLLKSNRTMTIFISFVALVFLVTMSSVVITGVLRNRAEAAEAQAAQLAAAEEKLREQILQREKKQRRDEAFAGIDVAADGVIVYDLNSSTSIFERNADAPLPIASITKIMTIVTASDYLDNDSHIYIDEEAINTEGESGLIWGEWWTFGELVDLTMIVSSNDASVAIAKAAGQEIKRNNPDLGGRGDVEVFVERMNKKAQEIGMKDSVFHNPSGLDLNFELEPGALSSPRDLAYLLSYVLKEKPDLLKNSSFGNYTVTSTTGRQLNISNTNYAADSMTGLLVSKTGNTLQAGGTLAVAVDMGVMQPVAIVVLGSTINSRVGDVETLYEAAKIYFENL